MNWPSDANKGSYSAICRNNIYPFMTLFEYLSFLDFLWKCWFSLNFSILVALSVSYLQTGLLYLQRAFSFCENIWLSAQLWDFEGKFWCFEGRQTGRQRQENRFEFDLGTSCQQYSILKVSEIHFQKMRNPVFRKQKYVNRQILRGARLEGKGNCFVSNLRACASKIQQKNIQISNCLF